MVKLYTNSIDLVNKFDTEIKAWGKSLRFIKNDDYKFVFIQQLMLLGYSIKLDEFKNFTICYSSDQKTAAIACVGSDGWNGKVYIFNIDDSQALSVNRGCVYHSRIKSGNQNLKTPNFGYKTLFSEDGKTLFISDPGMNNTLGCVHIYSLVNNKWELIQSIMSNSMRLGMLFGTDMSVCGDYLAVVQKYFVKSHVIVYTRNSGGFWQLHSEVMREYTEHNAKAVHLFNSGKGLITINDLNETFFYTYSNISDKWTVDMSSKEYVLNNPRFNLNIGEY